MRGAFLVSALVAFPVLGWFLSLVVIGAEPAALSWFALLGLPALLTSAVGLLARRTAKEIALVAFMSGAISALLLLVTILMLSEAGVFQ